MRTVLKQVEFVLRFTNFNCLCDENLVENQLVYFYCFLCIDAIQRLKKKKKRVHFIYF